VSKISIKNLKRGFTPIELLVVVANIGILSSVVLASLNSARNKAKIATTKAQLKQFQIVPHRDLFWSGKK